MWNITQERTNKVSKPCCQNVLFNVYNKRVSEPKQVANIFNEYFAKVGKLSADALPAQGPARGYIH